MSLSVVKRQYISPVKSSLGHSDATKRTYGSIFLQVKLGYPGPTKSLDTIETRGKIPSVKESESYSLKSLQNKIKHSSFVHTSTNFVPATLSLLRPSVVSLLSLSVAECVSRSLR
ncbi:hypothetical protein YC2023_096523 [Brassica napus]|uniref:(rape) hypothetical protein n=1 Tax=Brassica napus TaxID=3708 RepID=A0A817A933_BRANA|nr:unnamed protein product [Brassica napus]